MKKQQHKIFLDEIEILNGDLGLLHHVTGVDKQAPVMSGKLCHQAFPNGLSMHSIDVTEEQQSNNSMELRPGLSFNFIFQGQIQFSLGGRQCSLGKNAEPQVMECTAIINNRNEMMTRRMQKGMRVQKLNIYVEKEWLSMRCQSMQSHEQLNHLFDSEGLYQWQPDTGTWQQAIRLYQLGNSDDLISKLVLEHETTRLLTLCLSELQQQELASIGQSEPVDLSDQSLKTRLDQLLSEHHRLDVIAAQLNMSISTLQRKFKSRYQVSVSTYIRQWRMERARKALILEKLSIGEAAFEAGFRHTSNFVTAFKAHHGLTPSEYIKAHRIHH